MAVCPDGHQSGSDDFCEVCGLRITSMSQAQPAGDPWGSPSRAPGTAGAAGPAAPASWQGARGAGGDTIADPSCPQCGTGRTGRFCEGCGLDYTTGRRPDGSLAGGPTAPSPPVPAPTAPYSPTMYSYPEAPVPPAAPASAPPATSPRDAQGPASVASPVSQAPPPGVATWSVLVSADRAYYDKVRAASGPDAESITFPSYCPERQFTLSGGEMRIGRHSTSRGIYPEIDLTGPPTDPGVSRLHAVLIAGPAGWSVLDPGSANGTQVNGTDIPPDEQVPLHEGDRIYLGAWTVLTLRRP
jgi:FHA domain